MKSLALLFFFPTLLLAETSHPEYLLRFKKEVTMARAHQILRQNGLSFQRYVPEIEMFVAQATIEDFSAQQLALLSSSPDVAYVEENGLVHAFAGKKAPGFEEAEPAPAPLNVPSDPRWSEQSNMRRLEVEQAWDLGTGSATVIVAVTDTGVDYTHPDLASRIWVNTDEIAGNGIDDDQNGYVDDVRGYDFASNDNDPMDGNDHGTHVAGIIGAAANNGEGIAGVNWNVRIMPVQFLSASGSGSLTAAVDCILYAANNGAHVINASWGGSSQSQAIKDAIAHANGRGVLFVAAAGNSSNNADQKPMYPAAYDLDGILSVASSQADGELSSFSNFGAFNVDIAAPGSQILSSVANGGYERFSGTSMASPMAAGVAALILSQNPGLSPVELKNALMNAVHPRAAYSGKLSSQGDLSAHLALQQLSQGFQVWPARLGLNKAGGQHQLTAFQGSAVTWSSSNPSVATVDAQGRVTAVGVGNASITVQAAQGSDTVAVTVLEAEKAVGCKALNPGEAPKLSNGDIASRSFSMGMPFLFGFVAVRLRRRRRRRAQKRSC